MWVYLQTMEVLGIILTMRACSPCSREFQYTYTYPHTQGLSKPPLNHSACHILSRCTCTPFPHPTNGGSGAFAIVVL